MSLDLDAFLSDQIDEIAKAVPLEVAPVQLRLALRANRFGVAVARVPRDFMSRDCDIFAAALFGRSVQDFEAAVILARRGLRAQSRAMVRSTFETALYCSAACRDLILDKGRTILPKKDEVKTTRFVEVLDEAHQRFRAQMAGQLKTMPEVTPENLAKLDELRGGLETPSKYQDINVKGLSEDLGLLDLHTLIYRTFSQDAHPSATSLEHHVVSANDRIAGLNLGPDYRQLADTLALGVCSLLVAAQAFTARFGIESERDALSGLVAEYKALPSLG